MKYIYLRFIGLGYNDINQACIKIYDNNNNLIISKYSYNGYIKVCLKVNNIYRVYVSSYNEVINKYFYVNNYNINYVFAFNRSIFTQSNNLITFLLTDYYYNNLPIEKGNLILWQKQSTL